MRPKNIKVNISSIYPRETIYFLTNLVSINQSASVLRGFTNVYIGINISHLDSKDVGYNNNVTGLSINFNPPWISDPLKSFIGGTQLACITVFTSSNVGSVTSVVEFCGHESTGSRF